MLKILQVSLLLLFIVVGIEAIFYLNISNFLFTDTYNQLFTKNQKLVPIVAGVIDSYEYDPIKDRLTITTIDNTQHPQQTYIFSKIKTDTNVVYQRGKLISSRLSFDSFLEQLHKGSNIEISDSVRLPKKTTQTRIVIY